MALINIMLRYSFSVLFLGFQCLAKSRHEPSDDALRSGDRAGTKQVDAITQDRPGGPVAINLHAVRSLWVTQMTIASLDFATLTRIFGDSVGVTWERYLKADKSRPISQWTRDLAKAIAEGTD
jgi:hypothetical protein